MNTEEKDDKAPQVRVVDRRWWARGEGVEADESGARKPTYVEELERRVADASNQLQTYMTEHRRTVDEFDQVKARLRRDLARDVERGKRAVIAQFLDVFDNLDRAVAASDRAAEADPSSDLVERLARGVRLVREEFLATLERFGVVRVPSLGEPFDAARHEAVTTAPVADPAQDGRVVAIVKEGFAVGDELLRPASVVVGRIEK
jgi:molecular chaperone GrpE